MSNINENKLIFQVKDTIKSNINFTVVSFEAREAISESYEFKIQLRTIKLLDINNLLGKQGSFTIQISNSINKNNQSSTYHGIVTAIRGLKNLHRDDYHYYLVTLMPKFTRLEYSKKSDVFIQSGLLEILQSVFNEHQFSSRDYAINLVYDIRNYKFNQDVYNRYAHVCQYEEKDYTFINRLLERDGIYYYFKQGSDHEQLVITDTKTQYLRRIEGDLNIRPRSDQIVDIDPNAIFEIQFESKLIPKTVILKNFCYQMADKGERQDGVISFEQNISPTNQTDLSFIGEEVVYGENFINADKGMSGDGEFLAKIRAEEIYCRKLKYTAKSTVVPISAGMIVTIHDSDEIFNGDYLVVEVLHEGYQQIDKLETDTHKRPFYENILTLIPASVQFRPERKTPWPRIYGTMSAFIDGDETDDASWPSVKESLKQGKLVRKNLPQLNECGCYKVRLPFIKDSKPDGKGSIWLRLATPYAGNNYGLHFPLYKGTEVLLSFINGDPDLPVIMSAVFNSSYKNILNTETARYGGGIVTKENSIFFNDLSRKIESSSDGSLHTL